MVLIKALIKSQEEEIEGDFEMNHVQPSLMLRMAIEEEVSKLYASAMLENVQEELLRSHYYKCE